MSEQGKELVRRLYDEVINAKDLDAIDRFVRGEELVEGIKSGCFVMFDAFPDVHASIDDVIAEGDQVVVRATSTGTHDGAWMGIPPTGRHVAFEYVEIYRIADGMVVGYWCLPDLAGLMRQLTGDAPVTSSAGRD